MSIWCGSSTRRVASHDSSAQERVGAQQVEDQLPGDLGEHHLQAEPGPLALDQARVAAIGHRLGHPPQGDRGRLEDPFVIPVVGPHLQVQRAPVVRLDVRQDVEGGDLRSEELHRRPRLLPRRLLGVFRAGQDLEPLLGGGRLGRARGGEPGPGRREGQQAGQGERSERFHDAGPLVSPVMSDVGGMSPSGRPGDGTPLSLTRTMRHR